jgi:hypothetical protein
MGAVFSRKHIGSVMKEVLQVYIIIEEVAQLLNMLRHDKTLTRKQKVEVRKKVHRRLLDAVSANRELHIGD